VGFPTCSPRWTTRTASATARRFTGSRALPSRRRGACPREGRGRHAPGNFFRHNVVLSFQEDAIGIRLRDVIGVDNMMWGSDYPQLKLTVNAEKTRICRVPEGEFDFLGFTR
jgi:hypothetical protein